MTLRFTIRQRINRPVEQVFDAVADHEKMSRYFITDSSGPMRAGETVKWRWGDISSDTTVEQIVPNTLIVLRWEAYKVDYQTTCRFEFTQSSDGSTTVTVTEEGWNNDRRGLESAFEHAGGWQHMLLCLKAWLEHGTDLRDPWPTAPKETAKETTP